MLVMLHGCTQDPADFAAGTRMNAMADAAGFYVVYPAQTESANPRKCWNWFNPSNQQRDHGEPSLIAGITRAVMNAYPINDRQVYIAGLSAGGAMAVVLAATYPELYTAVGCHSGMPYRCAQTVFSALSAMNNGNDQNRPLGTTGIPMIVFQGDQDSTVNPRNGEQLISQWIDSMPTPVEMVTLEETGESNGRRYLHRTYRDSAHGRVAEYWLVHGAGHAWSGGSSDGSFTDPAGPDASREMVRFFLKSVGSGARKKERRRSVVSRILGAVGRRDGDQ